MCAENEDTCPILEFSKTPSPVVVKPGNDASFCVRVRTNSNDKPLISWEVAGKTVKPSKKFMVS